MKLIIDIDDYVLDTDIDSDWVSACRDELAESLNSAVRLSDVLHEIKTEIQKEENIWYHDCEADFSKKFDVIRVDTVIDIIDDKIKEFNK